MSDPFPSYAEILKLVYARLTGDATLMALVNNRIYNHLPQELPLPCLRFRWEQASEWDTKDSIGMDGLLVIDTWTDYRGDKLIAQIHDALMPIFHDVPLSMTSAQSLILKHQFHTSFTEGDGLTHHGVDHFRHVATT